MKNDHILNTNINSGSYFILLWIKNLSLWNLLIIYLSCLPLYLMNTRIILCHYFTFLHAINAHVMHKKEIPITTFRIAMYRTRLLLSLIQKSLDVLFFDAAPSHLLSDLWKLCGERNFRSISWRYLFGKWLGKITLLTTPFSLISKQNVSWKKNV